MGEVPKCSSDECNGKESSSSQSLNNRKMIKNVLSQENESEFDKLQKCLQEQKVNEYELFQSLGYAISKGEFTESTLSDELTKGVFKEDSLRVHPKPTPCWLPTSSITFTDADMKVSSIFCVFNQMGWLERTYGKKYGYFTRYRVNDAGIKALKNSSKYINYRNKYVNFDDTDEILFLDFKQDDITRMICRMYFGIPSYNNKVHTLEEIANFFKTSEEKIKKHLGSSHAKDFLIKEGVNDEKINNLEHI